MPERIDIKDKNFHSGAETTTDKSEKLIIYQLFPRIFTNTNTTRLPWGTLEQNGSGKLSDLNSVVLKSLKKLGVNALWLTGVIEHATKTDFSQYGIRKDNPNVVKGEAGSIYAIKDYYDIDPALAINVDNRLEEFEQAVARIHDEGLKVIIDFVPNHTAREYHSDKAPQGVDDFGYNDDTTKFFDASNNYYYIPNQLFSPRFPLDREGESFVEFPAKVTGNDCFSAFCSENDWYETVKLNYGKDYGDSTEHFDPIPDTWIKMLSILRYWASKGIDGFRCDMVFMVPLPFWHWAIPQVKADYPHIIFIGEIYDVNQYRPFLDYGCFDYLYDKVNLYDTLVGIEKHNYSAAKLTECWQTVDGIGDRMLNFLENHDEVRFASPSFANDPRKAVPYLVTSAMISKGPVMIYYGQELGESGMDNEGFAGNNHRTTIFDYWSVDTLCRWYNAGECTNEKLTSQEKWLRMVYSKILNLCNDLSSVRAGEFFDLMYANLQNPDFDPHSIFAWLRYARNQALLFIVNFRDEEKTLGIEVPDLAFEMASLPEQEKDVKDLIWNEDIHLNLRRSQLLKINIRGNNALIIPLRNTTT